MLTKVTYYMAVISMDRAHADAWLTTYHDINLYYSYITYSGKLW